MEKTSFDFRQKQTKIMLMGVFTLFVLSLITNILLLSIRQDTVVVLIPGEISGTYRISQSIFDERYLADASTTVAYLYLSATPASVDYRTDEIMRWVHPESTQKVAVALEAEAARIKSQRLTTSFAIKEVAVDATDGGAVVQIVGTLTRFITDRKFAQDNAQVTLVWGRDTRGAAVIKELKWEILE